MRSSQGGEVHCKIQVAEGPKNCHVTLRYLDPVMPRLDKNGLMAGSAECCEKRSAEAARLSNAAWRCLCTRSANIEELGAFVTNR